MRKLRLDTGSERHRLCGGRNLARGSKTRPSPQATSFSRRSARSTISLPSPTCIRPETSSRNFTQSIPYYQFRFAEGKETWLLVFGRDYLRELPALSRVQEFGGYYMELELWWLHFSMYVIGAAPAGMTGFFTASLCYKSVAEVLRVERVLLGEAPLVSRAEAIRIALRHAIQGEREFLDSAQHVAESRYLNVPESLSTRSLQFIARHINSTSSRLRSHPALRSRTPVQVDAPAFEAPLTLLQQENIAELIDAAKALWGSQYRSCHRFLMAAAKPCRRHPDRLPLGRRQPAPSGDVHRNRRPYTSIGPRGSSNR